MHRRRRGPVAWLTLVLLSLAGSPPSTAQAPEGPEATAAEARAAAERAGRDQPRVRWQYFAPITLPDGVDAKYADVTLTPDVFDVARSDLDDLRLYDAADNEIPYALRIRRPRHETQAIAAELFNRVRRDNGAVQLSLDLGEQRVTHNRVTVELSGENFRRAAVLEGSEDGERWQQVAETTLRSFRVDDDHASDLTIRYTDSRFRYLRLTVSPDPKLDEEPIHIEAATVLHRVRIPGEMVTRNARLSGRSAVRHPAGPASQWEIDLGGEAVPVSEITLRSHSDDFVRDYRIEAGPPHGVDEAYRQVAAGTWRRRAGEADDTLTATFSETRAARLRIIVIDHLNPPLELASASYTAAARQVVFEHDPKRRGPLRLYFGNPDAAAPRYDFARQLSKTLEPPPHRLKLGARQENPNYRPEPKPLTERWPWLIYVVLGVACAVLAALIANLARAAIARSDD